MDKQLKTEIITEYICSHRLTKKEFCKQCKISIPTFYRVMQNKNIKLITLIKIARKINLPIYKFFG